MVGLRAEVAEQAALTAQRHKFNMGLAEPAADASPERLALGLAATAQVLLTARVLYHVLCDRIGPRTMSPPLTSASPLLRCESHKAMQNSIARCHRASPNNAGSLCPLGRRTAQTCMTIFCVMLSCRCFRNKLALNKLLVCFTSQHCLAGGGTGRAAASSGIRAP